MSATRRGSERREADFYSTPKEAFMPLLPYVKSLGVYVFESACGDGRLVTWMKEEGVYCSGDDLNNGYDFLADDRHWGCHCILTNPPFSLAMEFCNKAISSATHVFMLLRLNFLASKKRREWFKEHEPDCLFVLSERPSFTEDGKTDATDYAWFYWGPSYKGIKHL